MLSYVYFTTIKKKLKKRKKNPTIPLFLLMFLEEFWKIVSLENSFIFNEMLFVHVMSLLLFYK